MSGIDGRCLCGSVGFTVELPTLFCTHCHCRYCRDAHGAAFVTWVGVREDQMAFTRGEGLVSWYKSSVQSRRGFCSSCGSTMFYTSSLSPGEVHIARPYLHGELDREPQAHVFYDQRVSWMTAADELPKIASDSELLAKYRAVEPE